MPEEPITIAIAGAFLVGEGLEAASGTYIQCPELRCVICGEPDVWIRRRNEGETAGPWNVKCVQCRGAFKLAELPAGGESPIAKILQSALRERARA